MRTRLGLKALGLCALLVGVMAISASGAQAAATWMPEGAELEGKLENNMGTLDTKINGLDIEILCTAGELIGNIKTAAAGATTNGKVKFTGCEVYERTLPVEKLVKLECEVHSPGQPVGTVVTEEGHGQLELSAGKVPITLIIPNNVGHKFAELEMLSKTEECVLPPKVPVIGSFAVKDCENKAEVEQATHLIEEEPLSSALYVINETNMEHLAQILGSATVQRVGGGNWSGLAG